MNYYFLLEDEKSFLKVLPYWLEHIGFPCRRVASIMDVHNNHYVLQSGQGVVQLVTKALYETIETIKQNPKKIDKLVVVLDAEDKQAETRKQEVLNKIQEKYVLEQLDFVIQIFVCNRCFETWLLGCEGIYPKDVESASFFYEYYSHYNIEQNDPEQMLIPTERDESIAHYHFMYLHEMFRYKRIRYNKKKPEYVASASYLEGMRKRIENTEHLHSFKEFIDFILNEIKLMKESVVDDRKEIEYLGLTVEEVTELAEEK